MKILIFSFALIFCGALTPVVADERAEVYRELSLLKKDYRKRISKIRTAGHDELKAEQTKSYQAIAAVGKAMEELPALEAQRKARDEAKTVFLEARKAGDTDRIKKTQRVLRDAEGTLARDAFKLKEVQDLQAASVAQRKKIDALQYQLVAASGEEGKKLIEKIKVLEARYLELKR